MAAWRFPAFDLRTNASLGELALEDVSLTQQVSGAGEFSARLSLGQRAASSASTTIDYAPTLTAATVPERTLVVLERDDVFVGAAIIWARTRTSDRSKPMELQGAELWSFFGRQRLRADKSYGAADQLAIAQDLVAWVATRAGGDIGVTIAGETSGVVLDAAWKAYERKVVAEIVEDLAGGDGGFDFDIAVGKDPVTGQPTKTFRCLYPRAGREIADTNLSFTLGKNMLAYNVLEDGTRSARTVDAVGAGDGDSMLIATASRTDLIDIGYPVTDDVVPARDITDADMLTGIALTAAAARSSTPEFWEIDIDPDDVDFPFGAWTIGDEADIVIPDDHNFPSIDGAEGFRRTMRIISQTLLVPGGAAKDTVRLTLGGVHG